MAEELDFESRTEAPTPRRREQAYERGQFAFSGDLNAGLVLFVGIGGMWFLSQQLGGGLLQETRRELAGIGMTDASIPWIESLLGNLFVKLLVIVGQLIGVLFAAIVIVNLGQVGLRFSTDRLEMNWERVLPLNWSKLFSWGKLVSGLMVVLKVAAVGVVAWWILRQRGGEIANLGDQDLSSAMGRGWNVVIRLALGLAGTLLIIGLVDYAHQRWTFERSLYMTKQEIKMEQKDDMGDPQIKARMRKMQRDRVQRKMFSQVPKATVVVTNPTHLAVAILYDPKSMKAPKVVAKGAGFIAKRIVAIAKENGVPTLERKPVAQALYKMVKVDAEVPFGLYVIVAELLAYVYKIKGGGPR